MASVMAFAIAPPTANPDVQHPPPVPSPAPAQRHGWGGGVETLGPVWTFLDLTPLGRQEKWEDSPAGYPQTAPYQWWRRHDEYKQEETK